MLIVIGLMLAKRKSNEFFVVAQRYPDGSQSASI